MNIQVRGLIIALAIGVPLAVAATAKSSAAPINGTSIRAAVPAVMSDVRYRAHRDYFYPSYGGSPTYGSYWGYPRYSSYWEYPTYNSYWSYPTYYYSYPGYAYGWW